MRKPNAAIGRVPRRPACWIPLLAVLLTGCLFEPRDPNPPSSSDNIPYLQQNTVENVWNNLGYALRNRDSSGWMDNISEEFLYIADSDTDAEYPGVFADWRAAQENVFINNFLNSDVTIDVQMRNDEFTPPDDGGASEIPWEGVIYYVQVSGGGSTTRYRASAKITFRLEQNFWYVYRWEDQLRQSDPDDENQLLPSMGVLRGNFGS